MDCLTCHGTLTGRQRMFCSIKCRNAANGKKTGGWNNANIWITCEECSTKFRVPPQRADSARACSRACLAAIQSRERIGWRTGPDAPNWIDGRSPAYYRRFLKEACERCGRTGALLIHHKDENRRNSAETNLETLCKQCHQLHHKCCENLPTYDDPRLLA